LAALYLRSWQRTGIGCMYRFVATKTTGFQSLRHQQRVIFTSMLGQCYLQAPWGKVVLKSQHKTGRYATHFWLRSIQGACLAFMCRPRLLCTVRSWIREPKGLVVTLLPSQPQVLQLSMLQQSPCKLPGLVVTEMPW
jgi:hypothetical protein